jgi:hypothetical protein
MRLLARAAAAAQAWLSGRDYPTLFGRSRWIRRWSAGLSRSIRLCAFLKGIFVSYARLDRTRRRDSRAYQNVKTPAEFVAHRRERDGCGGIVRQSDFDPGANPMPKLVLVPETGTDTMHAAPGGEGLHHGRQQRCAAIRVHERKELNREVTGLRKLDTSGASTGMVSSKPSQRSGI